MRRGVFVIVLLVLGTVIVLDVVAISTGFQDADGIFDCSPYCTTSQGIVRWSLTVAALLMLVLAIALVLREVVRDRPR